jgi:hypothetical protein
VPKARIRGLNVERRITHLPRQKSSPLHFVWTTNARMPWIKPKIAPSVVAYIQNQEDHHRNGSLWLKAKPDEEDPTDSE